MKTANRYPVQVINIREVYAKVPPRFGFPDDMRRNNDTPGQCRLQAQLPNLMKILNGRCIANYLRQDWPLVSFLLQSAGKYPRHSRPPCPDRQTVGTDRESPLGRVQPGVPSGTEQGCPVCRFVSAGYRLRNRSSRANCFSSRGLENPVYVKDGAPDSAVQRLKFHLLESPCTSVWVCG